MTTPYGNAYPPQEPQDNQPYGTPYYQQQPYDIQQPYSQPNPYQAMDKNDSSTGGILSTIVTAFTLGLPLLILIGVLITLVVGAVVVLFVA